MQTHLRVLIYREGDHFIAQCIEHDVVAQAKSQESLKREFVRVFVGTYEGYRAAGKDMFKEVPRAPKHIEEAFEKEEFETSYPSITVDHKGLLPKAKFLTSSAHC